MAYLIKKVEPGSAAEQAGLQKNDIIISADDKEVSEQWRVSEIMERNGKASLVYVRDGIIHTISVSGQALGVSIVYGEYTLDTEDTPKGFQPSKTPFTQYGTSKAVSTLGVVLGWLVILAGIVVLPVQGISGIWSSITLILTGFAIIQVSQISRAITDTADHAREIMVLLSRK